jgi:hypothetical protein
VVLWIFFVTKSASRITLEPANADDIEVELEEDDPENIETRPHLGVVTRLIMQSKSCGGDSRPPATKWQTIMKCGCHVGIENPNCRRRIPNETLPWSKSDLTDVVHSRPAPTPQTF